MIALLLKRFFLAFALALVLLPPLVVTPPDPTAQRFGSALLVDESGLLRLSLAGTPYEMGVQQGVLLRPYLHDLLAHTLYPPLQQAGVSVRAAQRFGRVVGANLPAPLRDEIRGIADGAGVSADEVLLWNLRDEMVALGRDLPLLLSEAAPLIVWEPSPSGPTVRAPAVEPRPWLTPLAALSGSPTGAGVGVALWGAATADGAPMLGASLAANAGGEALLLVSRQPTGGQPFNGLALPGEVGLRVGGNRSGLVLLAFPFATVDRALEGLPTRMLLRVALADTHSSDEALRLLVTLPRTGGASFLIADAASDTVQQVELSARQSRRVASEGEALRVAGAPLEGPLAAPADLLRQDDEAARGRLALWLRTARGAATHEALQALLGEPALSNHAVAALVWLPKQGDLWLAPAASRWRRVDLADGE